MRNVYVLGTGMIKFGRYPDKSVPEPGSDAALMALKDAGVTIQDVELFASGNLFQSNAMIGQRILQQIGQTGIPVQRFECVRDRLDGVSRGLHGGGVGDVRHHDGGRCRADGQAGTAWRRRGR